MTTETAPAKPELMTAEELLRRHSKKEDLIQGFLCIREKSGGALRGEVVANLLSELYGFVKRRRLGQVSGGGVGVTLGRNPDTVRSSTVIFVSADRLPPSERADGYYEIAPDIAAEVASFNDSIAEIHDKARMWHIHGVPLVWAAYPERRIIDIHRADGSIATLRDGDVLRCGDILPGFSIAVSDVFDLQSGDRSEWARTVPKPITAEEFIRMDDDPKGVRTELIRGVVCEMRASGLATSIIAAHFVRYLANAAESRRLGLVGGANGGVVLERDPDTVRIPDGIFISKYRLPPKEKMDFFPENVPDIIVEVKSREESRRETHDKARMWRSYGAPLVWAAYPETRTIDVHRADGSITTLTDADTLDGGGILPGFSVAVSDIFDL